VLERPVSSARGSSDLAVDSTADLRESLIATRRERVAVGREDGFTLFVAREANDVQRPHRERLATPPEELLMG
jgi:hypothetical protein